MMTNFAMGMKSFGMPVLGMGNLDLNTTGNVFFVDSGAADGKDSTDRGTSPTEPFLTVDYAIGMCTANNGDIIFVLPGHQENISAATSWVQDVAGIRIIGLGIEETRPTFNFTATAGSIEMDAANSLIANMVFVADVTAVVTGINMDADNCVVANCTFRYNATGDDFVQAIDIDAVDRCKVLNCTFIMEEAAGCDQAIRIDDAHHTEVAHCHFTGDFTDAMVVGEGALSNGVKIHHCTGYNSDATAGRNIRFTVATTGQVSDCDFSTAFATALSDTYDPGSMGTSRVTVSGPTDENAVSVPYGPRLEWRIAKHASTVFDGGTADAHGADGGALDPYTVFTVTGDVVIAAIWGVVNTTLTGATATLELGVASNTAKLLPQATATDLADGDLYTDTGAEANADVIPAAGQWIVINDGADIIETVGTTNITGGQIDYYCIWAPAEPGAHVAG